MKTALIYVEPDFCARHRAAPTRHASARARAHLQQAREPTAFFFEVEQGEGNEEEVTVRAALVVDSCDGPAERADFCRDILGEGDAEVARFKKLGIKWTRPKGVPNKGWQQLERCCKADAAALMRCGAAVQNKPHSTELPGGLSRALPPSEIALFLKRQKKLLAPAWTDEKSRKKGGRPRWEWQANLQ